MITNNFKPINMKAIRKDKTTLISIAVVTLILGYLFLCGVISSSVEIEAMTQPGDASSYLANHSSDRHLGFTYEGIKHFSEEAYMDLVVQAGPNSGIAGNVGAEHFLTSRIDQAGFPLQIEGIADYRFSLHIGHVLDSTLIKLLITKNIDIDIFETDGFAANSFLDKISRPVVTLADSAQAEPKSTPIDSGLQGVFTFQEPEDYNYDNPRLGKCQVKDTATVRQLFLSAYGDSLPQNTFLAFSKERYGEASLVLLKKSNSQRIIPYPALRLNSYVSDVSKRYNRETGDFSLLIDLNPNGAMLWSRITQENRDRLLAITIDRVVYSMPKVLGEITSGKLEITNLTNREAILFKAILEAPVASPFTFKLIEVSYVPLRLDFGHARKSFWLCCVGCFSCLVIMTFLLLQFLKNVSSPKLLPSLKVYKKAITTCNAIVSFIAKYNIVFWLILIVLAVVTVYLVLKMLKTSPPYNPIEFSDTVFTGLATLLFSLKRKAGWYMVSIKILTTLLFAFGYLLFILIANVGTDSFLEMKQLWSFFLLGLGCLFFLRIAMFSDQIRTTFELSSRKSTLKNLLIWMLVTLVVYIAIVILNNVA